VAKDLIIGSASGYTWDHLKYWVNSIRKTGFDGDVVIIGTDMSKATIDKLTSEGVKLELYGRVTEEGGIESTRGLAPHVERFFYIWNYLNTHKEYDRVITTDTRDVIFQKNPSQWLETNLVFHDMVVSSEGLRYENEPWGNGNLFQAFGPFFHNKIKKNYIYNVGVIAGNASFVEGVLLFIFQLSLGRPIPVVDQAVFNFIISSPPFCNDIWTTTHEDGWAAQLGTTVEAVKAGAGDIGKVCKDNATEFAKYNMNFEDVQPVIDEDGTVKTPNGIEYVIVHQYDRIPALKEKVEKKYND
jgi:hypothetical protein